MATAQLVHSLTLHFAQDGGGAGVPLVFVNSLGTDLRTWDGVVGRLLAFPDFDRPLFRYDKRGHGLSDCPPAPYSIDDHTDDLVGLLNALRIDAAVIVGISIGGLIALDLAIRNPDRVRRLVVCDTAAKIGTASGWNARIDAVRASGTGILPDLVKVRWFTPAMPAAEANLYLNMVARTPAEGYIGTCAALRDADLSEGLGLIAAPTLVLCGERDESTTPADGRALAAAIPNARFALIPGAAHLPHIEQPEAFSNQLRTFLRET
jgi:3-oxoadipate enol-lactonase